MVCWDFPGYLTYLGFKVQARCAAEQRQQLMLDAAGRDMSNEAMITGKMMVNQWMMEKWSNHYEDMMNGMVNQCLVVLCFFFAPHDSRYPTGILIIIESCLATAH